MYLSGYELRGRSGKLLSHRDSALVGSVSIEDFGRVNVDWFNERDKLGVAVEFARRVAPHESRIETILDSFETF